MKTETPLCSIIILSYNQFDYTRRCLESIARYTSDVPHEIIVIDNGSDGDTVEALSQLDNIRLIVNHENLGFAGGCNQGIGLASGSYIMLLNNDTIVTEHWLYNMVRFLEDEPDVSMTGPLTNATVGKQMIPVPYTPEDMSAMQNFASRIVSENAPPWETLRLVAFCILIRRELFDEIGLFDTGFQVGNYEDDDFNIRSLLAGKRACICRNSFIHHFMNVSFHQKDVRREQIMQTNKMYLEEKWKQLDWNHFSVCNSYMLRLILEKSGGNILHIGCGLGALELELKDSGRHFNLYGMEEHPLRSQIASQFLDVMYPFALQTVDDLSTENKKFDFIILEGVLEKWGTAWIGRLKAIMSPDALLLIRVFNTRHVTSIEKAVTGKVGGSLLCAVSDEFCHYYDKSVESSFTEAGYRIMEIQDVRKRLSSMQEHLLDILKDQIPDREDTTVYNRIYHLQ